MVHARTHTSYMSVVMCVADAAQQRGGAGTRQGKQPGGARVGRRLLHHGLSAAAVLPQMEQLRQQPGHGLRQPLQVRESHGRHALLRRYVRCMPEGVNFSYQLPSCTG